MTTKTKTKITKPAEEEPKVESQEVAAKAVEEILQGAADKASGMLQGEPEITGRSPVNIATESRAQADFLPGTRMPDPTYLPEFAYDETAGVSRRVTIPTEYHYIWVVDLKLTRFRTLGYRFCLHDGGSLSGLANRGLLGTGLYERTLDNHVRNGDTFLMFAPLRLYEQMQQADRDQMEAWSQAAQKDLHNEGYARGVRTFEEIDGEIIYN